MIIQRAKEVIQIETQAVKGLLKIVNKDFERAVNLIARCKGRIVVSGMGKTGIIGRKIAATFSSTGTPSIWMHSAEAVHGDLGQVQKEDVLIVLSHSGETEETVRILPLIQKLGTKIIAMTGNVRSTLAKAADVVLSVHVAQEGCPLNLAPMASTTATLVLGDALAACLIDRKKFKKEDFAFNHPGGNLGLRLLLRVEDVMRQHDDLAQVDENTHIKDVLLAITQARCGSACVVNKSGKLVGIFTDGDLRRHLEKGEDILDRPVKSVMTQSPTTMTQDQSAVEAFSLLKERKIDEVPIVDHKGKLVGLVDVQDLLKAGLV